MKYIFNSNGKCVASCNYEPNAEDLASRGEGVVESETAYQLSEIELVGGVITPVVVPEHIPTHEEIIKLYTEKVQTHLDSTAKTSNYDGILALCSYATSANPKFVKEGQAGVVWRDNVWAKCYEILAEVQAGTRAMPTDIISELPEFTWGD